jgi:hypothetical protein
MLEGSGNYFTPGKCSRKRAALNGHGSNGTIENSPAFQRRVNARPNKVPTGRLIGRPTIIRISRFHFENLGRPSGTLDVYKLNPALKCRAIFRCPVGTNHGGPQQFRLSQTAFF